jgi:hypothetical protein
MFSRWASEEERGTLPDFLKSDIVTVLKTIALNREVNDT